jgi:PAS domain S-box-containing protein
MLPSGSDQDAGAVPAPPRPSLLEAQRLAALHRYRLLDTPPEERFNDIVAVAAKLLDTPIALISLIDEKRQWFKARIGLDVRETPRDVAFCDHAIRERTTLVVLNAPDDPRFAQNPLVTAGPGIRFYAGAPLVTPDGHALGTVCVIDDKRRHDFGPHEREALEALSRLVVDHLELRRQAMLNAELTARAALRERLLRLAADAPDFSAAVQGACTLLVEASQALFCHVFRCGGEEERLHLVHGAGRGVLGAPDDFDRIRGIGLSMLDGPVAIALREDRQVVQHATGAPDLVAWPASSLMAAHGMAAVQIATPFGLLGERYAFVLGLEQEPPDLANLAEVMADVTTALRPLLRRVLDEEKARMFQRAVEASLDPVLITEAEPIDEPGPRIVYANEAFARETGYTATEVLGRSPRFLQGPDTSPEALSTIRRALKAWRPVRQVVLNYNKDGTPRLIELNIAPIADSTGWFTHWISVQQDVTERRQAEQTRLQVADELEHLIAGMPGALMRVGRNAEGVSTALYSSPSIEAITGYAPAEIKPGFMAEHLSEADLLNLRSSITQALLKGGAQLEFQFRHRDGRPRLILCSLRANPTPLGHGEVIMSWTDITKERLLADQLAHSAKLAQLGEVATGMAHELNQPLAGISLAAENALRSLARMPDAPLRAKEKLELILSLSQRASDTIDHMRIFGRTGSGPSGPVALADALAGAEALAQAKLKQTGVTLTSRLEDDLAPVQGKRIPLEQVLINLISNACDAYLALQPPVPAARRNITVSASCEHARVTLAVEDQAGGIAEDILPRIFEPFFTTKGVGQGTGLGLSISYGIITDMGGTLTARRTKCGTRFDIELPCAEAMA